MSDALLPPTFLFRFAAPCRYRQKLWSARGTQLGSEFLLPSFGELEGKPLFADLRGAWSEQGLAFAVRVKGKRQSVWCRDTRIEDSDGLQLWIDTRDAQNVHRATRFCHRFAFLPAGSGSDRSQPTAALVPINRAKADPKSVAPGSLQVRAKQHRDGYTLQAMIAAEALTGYEPEEQSKLGFSYAVIDRELGWQTFSVGPEFPFLEDPSLWGTLDLVR